MRGCSDFWGKPNKGHPDFERFGGGTQYGCVQEELDANEKPVLTLNNAGGPNCRDYTSKKWFDQWFATSTPSNIVQLKADNTNDVINFKPGEFYPLDGYGCKDAKNNHNYGFTSEVRLQFVYKGTETFTFSGDDDVWVATAPKSLARRCPLVVGSLRARVRTCVWCHMLHVASCTLRGGRCMLSCARREAL